MGTCYRGESQWAQISTATAEKWKQESKKEILKYFG